MATVSVGYLVYILAFETIFSKLCSNLLPFLSTKFKYNIKHGWWAQRIHRNPKKSIHKSLKSEYCLIVFEVVAVKDNDDKLQTTVEAKN